MMTIAFSRADFLPEVREFIKDTRPTVVHFSINYLRKNKKKTARSGSEIRLGGQVTFQNRMADGVRGGAPREIFAFFASK